MAQCCGLVPSLRMAPCRQLHCCERVLLQVGVNDSFIRLLSYVLIKEVLQVLMLADLVYEFGVCH